MSETPHQELSGVPETSLAALYWRAMESQRPDAILKDEKAAALVRRMSYDFDRVRQIPMNELLKVMRVMLTREMDRYARDFLGRHPEGVVVHIGCGLDSRFERVDNGQVEWYDLDLPDVIDLRRRLIGGEGPRYHLVGCSVLDCAWPDTVGAHRRRPILFLAENVFLYLIEAQVQSLVRTLRERFPGAELVFDGWKPYELWLGNREFSRSTLSARLRWGIWRGQEIERWGGGIRLLAEWTYIDEPDPRLAYLRWLRPLEHLLRTMRIYHFQLGKAD